MQKKLNYFDILVIAFGAMIGWGWVVNVGSWIDGAGGVGAALGFVLGGIMIFFIGLTYSELSVALPKRNGRYVFSNDATGWGISFVYSWAIVLSYVSVVCFEACALPSILQYLWPGFLKGYLYTVAGFDIYATWLFVAIFVAVLITGLNIRGTKVAANVQTLLVLVIGGAGIVVCAGAALRGDTKLFLENALLGENGESFLFLKEGARRGHFLREGSGIFSLLWQIEGKEWISIIKNIFKVAAMTPFYYVGFDVIPQVTEESEISLRKTGKVLLLSIALGVAFYCMIILSVSYLLPAKEMLQIAGAGKLIAAEAVAKAFRSEMLAKVIIIAGMCGILTSWNSFLMGGSRALGAMAESGMIPKIFGKRHQKYDTPYVAVLFIGALSILSPLLGRQMLLWISNAGSLGCCVAYCMVALSFLILRKTNPQMERPYKVKHGKLVGTLAILLSGFMATMYFLPFSPSYMTVEERGIVWGWILAGAALYFVHQKTTLYRRADKGI